MDTQNTANTTPVAQHLTTLHEGLTRRCTPEAVLSLLADLDATDALTGKAARAADDLLRYRARIGAHTAPAAYRKHPGLQRAYTSAERDMTAVTETAGLAAIPSADPTDPDSLHAFVVAANQVLGLPGAPNSVKKTAMVRARTYSYTSGGYTSWDGTQVPSITETYSVRNGSRGRRGDSHGHADPRRGYDAAARHANLPGVSVRTYRRAVRVVNHLEQRTAVLAAQRDTEAAVAFGKARLAHTIARADFVDHVPTAAFVAYYVARLGLRTVFTNGPQTRPMDDIAEELLQLALADDGVRADVIARVLTRQQVLDLLTEEQKGELLGVYYEQMAAFSRALRRSFDHNRDRTSMVARPGDDSSTWNAASRAFNQARTGWLNLTTALGLADVVEDACPGKVPALVAADVAHWHASDGGGQHADIEVFAKLPLPWDVILDGTSCPAGLVRQVCHQEGLDADATGWTSAYRQGELAEAGPTPELVHGVVISSPAMAQWLRAVNAFSGRYSLEDVVIG